MAGLRLFNPAEMPAHILAYNADPANKNIVDATRIPSLTYAGSRWALNLGTSEPKPIMVPTPGGGPNDRMPIPFFKGIILDYAKRRSRAYYPGTFDKDNIKPPACWSNDGIKPDASIANPQNRTCNGCKQAAQNSRIGDNGKGSVACGQRRNIALIPPGKLHDFPVLRLQIAITSDFDGRSPDEEAEGWFAFSNYMNHLRDNGVNNSALVITKMKFDTSENYPKILFSWDGWTPAEALARVDELAKAEETKALLITSYTLTGGSDDDAAVVEVEASAGTPKTGGVAASAEQQEAAKAASAKAAETAAKAAAAAQAAAAKAKAPDPAVEAKKAADKAKADRIAAAKAALAAAEAEEAEEAATVAAARNAEIEDDGLGGILEGDVVLPGTAADKAADKAKSTTTTVAAPPKEAKKSTAKKAEPAPIVAGPVDAIMGEWE